MIDKSQKGFAGDAAPGNQDGWELPSAVTKMLILCDMSVRHFSPGISFRSSNRIVSIHRTERLRSSKFFTQY